MQKINYWCDNDDLLKNYIDKSLNRFNCRISSSTSLQYGIIPRIIHFIWLGTNQLSPKFEKCIDSWKIFHSDWIVKVWTDDSIKDFYIENRDKFDNADNYGMKSDILRYEILFREGGVYIDVDYECLQSLDIITSNCSFFAGLSSSVALEVNNGIIGSVPNHPLLQKLISLIKSLPIEQQPQSPFLKNQISSFLSFEEISVFDTVLTSTANNDKYMRTIRETGPGLLTKTVLEIFSDPIISIFTNEIAIFPKHIFSPIPNTYHANLDNDEEILTLKSRFLEIDTIAVHWHQRSWQK